MTKKTLLFILLSGLFSPLPLWCQTTDVLTQHNDNGRTGWNSRETLLNTRNVNSATFGKLFTRQVDDEIYAQPLVVSGVKIGGGTHNIVLVATVNNTVYAFDADDSASAQPYWSVNLTPSGFRPPRNTDMTGACGGSYMDFDGNIGIVGTPVIDTGSQTLYLVTRVISIDGVNSYYQYLHALDIRSGQERPGSPVMINAQVPGSGAGSINGIVRFDPQKNNQRPGLLLLNGVVYISYSSHCDWGPYHGWVLGYDATTLRQRAIYCTTPDGGEGGIWMSGSGPSAGSHGNIYLGVGNGDVSSSNDPASSPDRGESLLKLSQGSDSLNVEGFFTPQDYGWLNNYDLDFGVTEALLIPHTRLLLAGCKNDSLYLCNRDSLGGLDPSGNQVIQQFGLGSNAALHASLGYYQGQTGTYVYAWSENAPLDQIPFDSSSGLLNPGGIISSGVQGPIGGNGAFLAVSSDGSLDSTAILWASYAAKGDAGHATEPGILRAFSATDVRQELWNSQMDPNDNPGNYAKFNCPTIANGKVYLATFSNQLVVYGLHPALRGCQTPDLALNRPALASSVESGNPGLTADLAVDGNLNTRWSSQFSDPQWLMIDLGSRYAVCEVIVHWEHAYATDFQIQVSDDSTQWNTLDNITGNQLQDDTLYVSGLGRYIRMYGTARATSYGYSIWEMQVYGAPAASCASPSGLSVSGTGPQGITLHWGSTGAPGYLLEYRPYMASDWNTRSVSGDSLSLDNLSCGENYLYRVRAVCGPGDSSLYSGTLAFSTSACTAACGPLPLNWYTLDLGPVGAGGSACYANGIFTLQGSGTGMGGNQDGFRFAYRQLYGDGDFVAKVLQVDQAYPSEMAGLMIRDSLTAGSRNVFIGLSAGMGAWFQYRNSSNYGTLSSFTPLVQPPYWVRISKSGDRYQGFISRDGISWTQVGAQVDPGFGNAPVFLGLAMSSQRGDQLGSAQLTFGETPGSNLQTDTLTLYPNPVHTQVTISLGLETIRSIRVYDMEGREQMEIQAQTSPLNWTLNTAALAGGIYLVVVQTSQHTYRRTFIKQ